MTNFIQITSEYTTKNNINNFFESIINIMLYKWLVKLIRTNYRMDIE
jgi:hypothetical protein